MRWIRSGHAFAVIAFVVMADLHAVVPADEDGDGMGDFWEQVFGAEALLPDGDADGDGSTNLEESCGGTDPFDPRSVLALGDLNLELDVSVARWDSKVGHVYWVQSSADGLGGWQDETAAVWGNGGEVVAALTGDRLGGRTLRLFASRSDSIPKVPGEQAGLLMSHDSDADGQSDLIEFGAGTDPFDAGSNLALTSVVTSNVLRVSLNTEKGKWYLCERRPLEPGAVWVPFGQPFPGAGGITEKIIPIGTAEKDFVRFRVMDADTDSDGASDWEEGVAGSDPLQPNSVVGFDSDAELIASFGALEIEISIEQEWPTANLMTGLPGKIRIVREGNLGPVDVGLMFFGTAIAGTHYRPLADQIRIPGGQREVVLDVEPLSGAGDPEPGFDRNLVVVLEPREAYQIIGPVVAAEVRIVRDAVMVVTDFGATGDGVTDDTAAVQAALDAFASDPSFNRLHFPAGRYRLDSWTKDSLTWTSTRRLLRLEGEGLDGRDLRITGDEGAVLYSTVSPERAHMLEVIARFRSIAFEGLGFEKDPVPLRFPVGEPNGADGVSVVLHDERRVDAVSFADCRFVNCHGASHVYGSGYDIRGRLARFEVSDCEILNPYGANTVDSLEAFGGGQQFKLTPWIGRAIYRGNLFDGGGEDMTDESTSPGGRLKDGGHFGSPLDMIFEGNTVMRMGVEAFFHINDITRMGGTDGAFEIPPADGSTVAVTLLPARSTYQVDDVLNIRTALTPGQLPSNNYFRIESVDALGGILHLTNTGHLGNEPPGTEIPARQSIYKDNEFESGVSEVSGNYFNGEVPPGGVTFSGVGGIMTLARSRIHDNLVVGFSRGIVVADDAHTPLHPGGHACEIRRNVVLTRAWDETQSVYNVGVLTYGPDHRIADNFVLAPQSRHVLGIGLRSQDSVASRNWAICAEILDNGYASPIRSVGFACGNVSERTEFRGNTSRGFDVGVGSEQAWQIIPHLVDDHRSVSDQLAIDPTGAVSEWPE